MWRDSCPRCIAEIVAVVLLAEDEREMTYSNRDWVENAVSHLGTSDTTYRWEEEDE